MQLLSALGRHPLESVAVLSREAGMTAPTFARRLRKLYQERVLLSISAEVSYASLGLEPVLYFLESPFRSMSSLELALDFHPYTRYRVRSLGAINGLYTLFAVPTGTIPLLNEFIDELAGLGHVRNYHYDVSTGPWAYSETDFSFFDLETGSWGFNWRRWESGVLVDSPPHSKCGGQRPSVLNELDHRDMSILRQLSVNAARRKTDIALEAKVPTTT